MDNNNNQSDRVSLAVCNLGSAPAALALRYALGSGGPEGQREYGEEKYPESGHSVNS